MLQAVLQVIQVGPRAFFYVTDSSTASVQLWASTTSRYFKYFKDIQRPCYWICCFDHSGESFWLMRKRENQGGKMGFPETQSQNMTLQPLIRHCFATCAIANIMVFTTAQAPMVPFSNSQDSWFADGTAESSSESSESPSKSSSSSVLSAVFSGKSTSSTPQHGHRIM